MIVKSDFIYNRCAAEPRRPVRLALLAADAGRQTNAN